MKLFCSEPHKGTSVYHMSFLLYALLGSLLTIVFANLATFVFGRQDVKDVDENLLAPFVQRYLRKKKNYYETVELKTADVLKIHESSD